MKAEKKSFLFHFDWLDMFAELSCEEQSQLLMTIGEYARNGNYNSDKLDKSLQMVFVLIRQQLDRDKEKYIKRCEARAARAANGKKGGRPSTNSNDSIPAE